MGVDERTARLQGELAEARAELARKDALVSSRLTQERVGENRALEEEDASESTAWTLFAVVVILLIIMIGVLLCMGLYIKSQKRQRRNAREVEQHSARYAGESSDIEGSEKKTAGAPGSRLVAVGALQGPHGFNDPYNVPDSFIPAAASTLNLHCWACGSTSVSAGSRTNCPHSQSRRCDPCRHFQYEPD